MPFFNICSPLVKVLFSLVISSLFRAYPSSSNYNVINYSLHITIIVMLNRSSFICSRIPS
nr:MAG TPA: hypothetical protein [Bacteriophage sp.]